MLLLSTPPKKKKKKVSVAITSSSLRKEKKEITNQQWMRVQMSLLYLNSGATVFYYLKKIFLWIFY